MIILAVLFGFNLLMAGGDIAAIYGGRAMRLELPGSGIIPYVLWLSVGAYALMVFGVMRIKSTAARWAAFVLATALAYLPALYPLKVLSRGSVAIPVAPDLTKESLQRFEKAYPVKYIRYSDSREGSRIRVQREDYSEAMAHFLRDLSENQEPKKDSSTP